MCLEEGGHGHWGARNLTHTRSEVLYGPKTQNAIPTQLRAGAASNSLAERPASAALEASPDGFSLLKASPDSEIFTKPADVKSRRMTWTAERRRLLETLWERGEKAPAIAAALGCKVGAVNVARARFGLKPRRAVSGRPKQEPDEPAHKIERVAFTTSRLIEFCTEKELVAQTGHGRASS